MGFLGPEDAIVFASTTAHEARIGIILDGVDAIGDGLISFYHAIGETNQERVFPGIAASALIRVLSKAQISSFRNQPVKYCLLAGDSSIQIFNLGLLLGDLRFGAGECRIGLLGFLLGLLLILVRLASLFLGLIGLVFGLGLLALGLASLFFQPLLLFLLLLEDEVVSL